MKFFKSKTEIKKAELAAANPKKASLKSPPISNEQSEPLPEDTVGEEGGGQGVTRGIWGGSLAHERSRDT